MVEHSLHARILKESLDKADCARNNLMSKNKTTLNAEIYLITELAKPGVEEAIHEAKMNMSNHKQLSRGSKFGIANPGYPPDNWRKANANVHHRMRNYLLRRDRHLD